MSDDPRDEPPSESAPAGPPPTPAAPPTIDPPPVGVAPPPPPPATAGGPHEERMWAMACHLAGFAGYVIPFGNLIAPLVIWLALREKWPLVDDQGKEALNFQISMTIWILIAAFLCIFCVGIPILIALLVADVVLVILAAIRSSEGVAYRYPLTVRLVQ